MNNLCKDSEKALDLKDKCIEVFGDSQIVSHQMRNSINFTSNHLKYYQREVWDLISKFEAFNIKSISHTLNFEANMLVNATSNLCPSGDFSHNNFFFLN